MNECFMAGRIISEVEFSFTFTKEPISIASFDMELSNKSNIKIYIFNEVADYGYKNFRVGQYIFMEGTLISINNEVRIIAKSVLKV